MKSIISVTTQRNLEPIKISRERLFRILKKYFPKRDARKMAFGSFRGVFRTPKWYHAEMVRNLFVYGPLSKTTELIPIRLLVLYGCRLNFEQQIIFCRNKQYYEVVD